MEPDLGGLLRKIRPCSEPACALIRALDLFYGSATFNFMLVFQAEHNILPHQYYASMQLWFDVLSNARLPGFFFIVS